MVIQIAQNLDSSCKKKHSLVSIEDAWTTEAACELIDRYLAVESKKWLVAVVLCYFTWLSLFFENS